MIVWRSVLLKRTELLPHVVQRLQRRRTSSKTPALAASEEEWGGPQIEVTKEEDLASHKVTVIDIKTGTGKYILDMTM